jgi:hypothetical protein
MQYRKLFSIIVASSLLAGFTAQAEGLLGQRTLGVGASYVDAGNNLDGYGFGLEYAQPLIAPVQDGFALDVRAGYGFVRVSDSPLRARAQTLSAELVGYAFATQPVRPFATVGLGYVWERYKLGSLRATDDGAVGSVGVGVEWEVAPAFTLTPSITYGYEFSSPYSKSWTSAIEAAYWITPEINLALGFDYTNVEGAGQVRAYTAALRYRF